MRVFYRKGFVVSLCLAITFSSVASAVRLKEIASVAGVRGNQLVGYGLVVGLDATGDSSGSRNNSGVSQSVLALLEGLDVPVAVGSRLSSRNVAAVIVTTELPALAQPGQKLDITVSSLGDAKSLKGGTLLMTPLRAANGQIYATAQGSLLVPESDVVMRSSRRSVTQLATGRIPGGAYVELAAPQIPQDSSLELIFDRADYAQTEAAVNVMKSLVGDDSVQPINSRIVSVDISLDPTERMNTLAKLMELDIPIVAGRARVVMNSRTGSVVMNQSVSVAPFAVTHGNISVRVTPRRPFVRSIDESITTRNPALVSLTPGPEGRLIKVDAAASLDQLVRALNMLGVNPQDLMAILQAMKASGALQADLEVI